MDNIDYNILLLLQENARSSISEISSQVNLSISAVSERLHKLEQSGMIEQYTAILSPEAFNKNLCLFIAVSFATGYDSQPFLDYVAETDDIVECYRMASRADFYARIITENNASLEQILKDLRACPGLSIDDISLATSKVKAKPSISPNHPK